MAASIRVFAGLTNESPWQSGNTKVVLPNTAERSGMTTLPIGPAGQKSPRDKVNQPRRTAISPAAVQITSVLQRHGKCANLTSTRRCRFGANPRMLMVKMGRYT